MYRPVEDRIDFRFLDGEEAVCSGEVHEKTERAGMSCVEYMLWCLQRKAENPYEYAKYEWECDLEYEQRKQRI